MNCLSYVDETYRVYSLAPTDDPTKAKGQRSRSQQAVKVAKTSRRPWDSEVHLLVGSVDGIRPDSSSSARKVGMIWEKVLETWTHLGHTG